MGNDIDVLSKDSEIDDAFWRIHGPKNESTLQFFKRSYGSFCARIHSPTRVIYDSSDIQFYLDEYEIEEYSVISQGVKINCCQWLNREALTNDDGLCVVYLHTNTRNLSDALEVIPFCNRARAHLFAMDLPGAGKSDGKLSISMTKDFAMFMESIADRLKRKVHVILWARGMSTGIAIDYLSKIEPAPKNVNPPFRFQPTVIYCVLDTPFESVKLMIDECLRKLSKSGYQLPELAIDAIGRLARRSITQHLQGDPYAVEPIQHAAIITVPCMIIVASNDDYIPCQQCFHIAEAWKGISSVQLIEAGHFGRRSPDTVLYTYETFNSLKSQCRL